MSARRVLVILAAATCAAVGLVATPLSVSAASAAVPASAVGAVGAASPAKLNFPDTYAEEDSAPLTVTMTSTGTDPLVIYGPVTFEPDDYDNGDAARITASTCDGATLAPGAHCTVTVVAHPETIGYTDGWLQFHNNSAVAYVKVIVTVTALEPATGLYYPVAPSGSWTPASASARPSTRSWVVRRWICRSWVRAACPRRVSPPSYSTSP